MPSKTGAKKETGRGKSPAPLAVGLTGNIGSGKSTAAGIFSELGVPTFDTDRIGHELLDSDQAVRGQIARLFGRSVVEDGPVDRRRLGEIVFGDPGKRRKLEGILHPAIMAAARKRIFQYKDRPYAIVEVPLLYEAKLAREFDYVILVKTDEASAIRRATTSLRISRDEVMRRLAAQIPQSEKEKLADFVIANNGTRANLRQKVLLLHSVLSSLSPKKDQ